MLVLPKRIEPALASRAVTALSPFGTEFSRIFEPAVVRIPRVEKLSFSEMGMPKSGLARLAELPRRFLVISRSAARACFRERSASTVIKALMPGSSRSIRERDALTRSTGEISRRLSKRAACSMERNVNSDSDLGVTIRFKKSSPLSAAFRRSQHWLCEKRLNTDFHCESNRMKTCGIQNRTHSRNRYNWLRESGFEKLAA